MRRFLLWRKQDPTGVSGTGIVAEGIQFADGVCGVRWHGEHATTTIHASLASVKHIHLHGGATRILWADPAQSGPQEASEIREDRPARTVILRPTVWLTDGWREPNGVTDVNDVPLWVGQRVKMLRGPSELSDTGEITAFWENDGRLMVTLYGVNCCGQAGVNVDEILALETTQQETRERNGGKIPTYGWRPAMTIGGDQ